VAVPLEVAVRLEVAVLLEVAVRLEVAVLLEVAVRLEVAVLLGVAVAVGLATVWLPADCAVAEWAVPDGWPEDCALLDSDSEGDPDDDFDGDAPTVEQLFEADTDGDELAEDAALELAALLEPAEEDWLGLDALGLAEAVTLVGPVPGFGGRLVTGGLTWVTSPTTGNGLSGSAEAPSR
jgi:hypothetical protein